MAYGFLIPPLTTSRQYNVPCEGGVALAFKVRVFAAATLTNQPRLVCKGTNGQSDANTPATAADSTGTQANPSTWEQITLTLTTTTNGVIRCWVENLDPSVSIYVAEIGKP